MAEQVLEFLKEQRHIFGSCPHCQEIFRLNDVRVSYKTAYKPDWMDELDKQIKLGEEKLELFEQNAKEMREKAIAREKARRWPKILNAAVPLFAKRKIFPQDVKTLFDPIDFVVFDGMNQESNVKRVLLLDNAAKTSREKALHESIQNAIETSAITWKTIQIGKEGKIAVDC